MSHSRGETADTLAALREAKSNGQRIGAVVNVTESSIARDADVIFPTSAGPEIGVASTKAFTCQLATLACLAVKAGAQRGVLSRSDETELVTALMETPRLLAEALQQETANRENRARSLEGAGYPLYRSRRQLSDRHGRGAKA